MPKTAAKPPRATTKARATEDEEDDEDEAPVRKPKATSRTNGKVAVSTKPAAKPAAKPVTKPKKSDDSEGTYAPNANSMRAFVMRAMRRGGTSAEIKKRAARFAERAEVEALADPKAYKSFDVAYFAKFLKDKGFDVTIDVEADTYSMA